MENSLDAYQMLEEKLKKAKIPYSRSGCNFYTSLIFNADLQKYAKECGLVKYETTTANDIVPTATNKTI